MKHKASSRVSSSCSTSSKDGKGAGFKRTVPTYSRPAKQDNAANSCGAQGLARATHALPRFAKYGNGSGDSSTCSNSQEENNQQNGGALRFFSANNLQKPKRRQLGLNHKPKPR